MSPSASEVLKGNLPTVGTETVRLARAGNLLAYSAFLAEILSAEPTTKRTVADACTKPVRGQHDTPSRGHHRPEWWHEAST